jgi:hypothetical protein
MLLIRKVYTAGILAVIWRHVNLVRSDRDRREKRVAPLTGRGDDETETV